MNTQKLVFLVSVVCISTAVGRGAEKAPAITDLGRGTEMLAINDKAQVAFTATNSSGTGYQAALWEKGNLTKLGFLPGDTASWAGDLNKRGQVVGWSTGTCFSRAFVWQQGVITPLGEGCSSKALGINDRGQIVGWSQSRAVMWQDGAVINLNVPSSVYGSSANAINNRGQIVGDYDVQGSSHAFLWEPGKFTDLGLLPGSSACGANDINDRGQVVGWCYISSRLRAVLWDEGVITPLAQSGGIFQSNAGSISKDGQIVGSGNGADYQSRALMWKDGSMIDLNTLISPSVWRLTAAYDINDRGQIVGLGSITTDFPSHGFLLDLH